MLLVVRFTVQQLLDGRMKRSEALLLLGVGEVDGLVGSRGSYVELGMEDIDAGDEPAQPWKREGVVALVLPRPILAAPPERLVFTQEQPSSISNQSRTVSETGYLPAISWYVLVMMKSVVFIAIMSAVNWHEKWYLGSSSFHFTSESSYLVFSRACAIVPCSSWLS